MEDRQLTNWQSGAAAGLESRDTLWPIIFSARRFELLRLCQWLGTGCLAEGDL
jgi:hypothetical protein